MKTGTNHQAIKQNKGIVSKDNATKVIGLLDDAQIKIDEARELDTGTSGTNRSR